MTQPTTAGRGMLFWGLVVGGGSCAACSLLTLMALGLVAQDATPSTTSSPQPDQPQAGSRLATGETPNTYPGQKGWLPSGRGVPIPEARVVGGRPQGLWWHFILLSDGNTMGAGISCFLSDGSYAINPRPGSGRLIDVEGQRAQRGSTGVGTFSVQNDTLTLTVDRYTSTERLVVDGESIKVGANTWSPLWAPRPADLVGAWKSPSSHLTLNADGTFDTGLVKYGGGYVVAGGSRGRWQVDGYLLQFTPADGAPWIDLMGRSGNFLIVGQTAYTR